MPVRKMGGVWNGWGEVDKFPLFKRDMSTKKSPFCVFPTKTQIVCMCFPMYVLV